MTEHTTGQDTNRGDGATITVSTLTSLSQIAPETWDACACPETADGGRPYDPFTTHRFLKALEDTAVQAAPNLPRVQSAALLLRVCGLGRLTHLTRLLPPAATEAFAAAAVKATLDTYMWLL